MNHTLKKLTLFALVLTITSLVAFAQAGDMNMMAGKDSPQASATMHLTKDNLTIHATGLKPDSVYTVWFVNMKPKKSEAGAGSMPYMFKTDFKGEGTYNASLSESPFGKWQMVMVMRHPDGDPGNMKNMAEALAAKVPKAK
jgi:hypothetical protein